MPETLVVRRRTYYDRLQECYREILVLNRRPTGALAAHTRTIRPVPLSPFQADAQMNECCEEQRCIVAITGPYCGFFPAERVADFFVFAIELGYSVDTALTKLTRQSGDATIIAILTG